MHPQPTPGWPPPDSLRRRLQIAVIELSTAEGFEALSVEAVCRLADVPHDSFFATFGSAEECLLGAVDDGIGALQASLGEISPGGGRREALERTLACLAADPQLSRLIFRDLSGLGRPGQVRRDQAVTLVAESVDRAGPDGSSPPPQLLGTMVAGGLQAVVSQEQPLTAERAKEIAAQISSLWSPWFEDQGDQPA